LDLHHLFHIEYIFICTFSSMLFKKFRWRKSDCFFNFIFMINEILMHFMFSSTCIFIFIMIFLYIIFSKFLEIVHICNFCYINFITMSVSNSVPRSSNFNYFLISILMIILINGYLLFFCLISSILFILLLLFVMFCLLFLYIFSIHLSY